MQVQGGGGKGGAAVLYMYKGPVEAITTIVAKEGWRTFYKGYATITQTLPGQAIYMATYQSIKRYVPGKKSPLNSNHLSFSFRRSNAVVGVVKIDAKTFYSICER